MGKIISLPVGYTYNQAHIKEVELLSANGVAEKVYVKKLSQTPYTWQARVLAVSIKSIAGVDIAVKARQQFVEHNDITIPPVLLAMTMADMNSLIVEIHRNLWRQKLPEQEFICKTCGDTIKKDVDLGRIQLLPEDVKFLSTKPNLNEIIVYLEEPFECADIPELQSEEYTDYHPYKFNKFTYRPPTISDGIYADRFAREEVVFWRRVAYNCLTGIYAVENPDTPEENTLARLPEAAHTHLSMRLYDEYLSGQNLRAIREELSEYLPTMPYFYLDTCPCERKVEIPHVMEGTNFFSA